MVDDKDYSIFKVYFNNNFKIIIKAFDELSKKDELIKVKLGKLHNDKAIRSAMIRAYLENYVKKNNDKLPDKLKNEVIKYFEDKDTQGEQNEPTKTNN
jgi:hypothetical protein